MNTERGPRALLMVMGGLWLLLAGTAAALQEGAGLAQDYPGDEGIEGKPRVVFVERFDEDLETIFERYDDVAAPDRMQLDADTPPGAATDASLLMTHVGGAGDSIHLFTRLPGYEEGYDKLHLRFYVKFDEDCWPVHHFVGLGGYHPPSRWPQGQAGRRPEGDDRFSTAVETFGSDWRWDFYTYWSEMRGNPTQTHYGNNFVSDPGFEVTRGEWICVEFMVKLNTPPDERDGEQAFWIDGELHRMDGQVVSHLGPGFPRGSWTWDTWTPDPDGEPFDGFRWRTTEDLAINSLWLSLYITGAPEDYESKVWLDHVVVAEEYIGPLAPGGNN